MGVLLVKRGFRWCAGRLLTLSGCWDTSFFLQQWKSSRQRAFCWLLFLSLPSHRYQADHPSNYHSATMPRTGTFTAVSVKTASPVKGLQAASRSPLLWQFGTLLLHRQILASGQAFWLIPFCHVDIQQSTIDSNRLEKAGVDIGGMVVGYFRFGRVTRHRQPGRAGGTERRMRWCNPVLKCRN